MIEAEPAKNLISIDAPKQGHENSTQKRTTNSNALAKMNVPRDLSRLCALVREFRTNAVQPKVDHRHETEEPSRQRASQDSHDSIASWSEFESAV